MTVFFDTNVLVYTATSDPRKRQADRIIRAGGIVSVQVLHEIAHVASRRLRQRWDIIEFALEQFRLSLEEIRLLTYEANAAALKLARNDGFCFYDALIVASAIEAGCDASTARTCSTAAPLAS